MLFVSLSSLWASLLGIVRLVFNLGAYDFVFQEFKATEDPEVETFYTKNILLNEGISLWMAVQDQPIFNFRKKFYQKVTHSSILVSKASIEPSKLLSKK